MHGRKRDFLVELQEMPLVGARGHETRGALDGHDVHDDHDHQTHQDDHDEHYDQTTDRQETTRRQPRPWGDQENTARVPSPIYYCRDSRARQQGSSTHADNIREHGGGTGQIQEHGNNAFSRY